MSKFGTVSVSGQSMQPTFSDGDWLCVRWLHGQTSDLERGAIVVIEREERPGIFLVKRIQKFHSGRYWVEGDSTESTDSRQWGWISPHEIRGKFFFVTGEAKNNLASKGFHKKCFLLFFMQMMITSCRSCSSAT